MFTKVQIFNDIQKIMQYDYAGYLDKKHVNHPECYSVTNNMSDLEFVETIKDYLLDFNDGHLGFISKKSKLSNVGFTVRNFEDALYVTESSHDNRLNAGDKIVQIDGVEIGKLTRLYSKRLKEVIPERQRWDSIIDGSKMICVERDSTQFELELSSYKAEPYKPCHIFKQLNNKTTYIKITDFAAAKPILSLINENRELLEQTKNLIIDVRLNKGGNDTFYFPLLHYIFKHKFSILDLFDKDEVMYTNYTENNCRLWIQELDDYLKQQLDIETVDLLNKEIQLINQNRGKGLIEVSQDINLTINGQTTPEYVYILTDYFCGSSGDTFVANAKKSPKVTVVGRHTMGIMDYFNVVTINYGDYEFWYSISKMNENYYINGKGVEPHIYIPWTPEHIKEDKDLAFVLDIIESNTLETKTVNRN